MASPRTMGTSGELPVVADNRLSALPDGLLHTIQSFLTARQAVQTCVLSRRWEDLWCSMPCLEIDGSEFHAPAAGSGTDGESDDEDCTRFEDFVNTLLMFHSAPTLDRLCIRVHCHESKFVERWVRHGIKCCPKVVEIRSKSFCRLPHLGSSFSRLNRLHLVGIVLDGTFSQQLRSGCSVLEDLELKWCTLNDPEIASCTLKNLIIEDCGNDFGGALTIKVSPLVYFQLDIMFARWNWHGVVVSEMPSLIKATICLASYTRIILEILCELLCTLINVRDLTLSGFWTLINRVLNRISIWIRVELYGSFEPDDVLIPPSQAILHAESDTFPVFHNLRTLLFERCDLGDNFEILRCFLNNAPILEKLTLQHCELPEVSRKRKTRVNPEGTSLECQDPLTFQCPNLKWTVINYKEDDVHRLFGLLLGIWRNLQKTTIVLNKA